MTLHEQNVQPDMIVTAAAPPEAAEVFPLFPEQDPDGAEMLRHLVSAGWDDRSLAEAFRRELALGVDEDFATRAYQLAKRVVTRDRTDEEACELLGVMLEVLERAGWSAEARLIAARVGGLSGASDALRRQAAGVLLDGGSHRVALSLLEPLTGAEDRALAARCLMALGDPEGALEAATAALDARSGATSDLPLLALITDAALAVGRPEAALSAIHRVPKASRGRDLLLKEAAARELSSDLKGAARPLRTLLERSPEDLEVRGRLVRLLRRSGQEGAARSAYRDGLPHLEARLPETTDGLFEEPSRLGLTPPIPEGRAAWVRGVTGEDPLAGEAQEVLAFDQALLAWVQTRPDRVRELTYRVRLSEAAQRLVMDMHLRGRGALIVGAHVGLVNGGLLALEAAGVRYGFAGPSDPFDLPHLAERLIPTDRSGPDAVRGVIRRLRDGQAVGLMIDGATGPGTRPVRLFDREVRISDLCARLASRLDVPTLFPRVLPGEGGVINVDLRPLPTPVSGQDAEAHLNAWAAAWAAEVEELIRTAPWAMRGVGGLWDAFPDA